MKIKTKLLDTFEKSFERLYQIRDLIREGKMDELSKEINEFYEQNETIIKKWKAVFDFDSKINPFPIKEKELFAKPVFKQDSAEGEKVWRCLIDSDIDQRTNDYHYLDIIINYNNKHLEIELYEWYYFPEDAVAQQQEEFNNVIFSCFFNKGLEKNDLDNVTTLLFAFVYMGGELGKLEYITTD
jgi:hypothetical protein